MVILYAAELGYCLHIRFFTLLLFFIMKLHLPVMLRRSLLAITALLSPAVVTTTIATATLTAITAPAMAVDLDLTSESPYEFSGSPSFDSVTTGSPNDVIKATAGGSTFTAGIVTIGTGHTLTITNSGYHDWSFKVKSLDTSQGGSIKINAFASMYATGTFYDLYNKIEANSIEVWGAGAWYIYGKGHSDSETTNLVKTSDLFEKLSTGYRTFFNITEGNVIIDKNISDNSNSWLNIGVENGTKDTYATVSTNVTQLSIATQIFSGSKMEIEESSEALTVDRSIYVYGELVSNRDLILEGDAYFESEADVTLNGHTTINQECTARGILTTVGGITVNNGAKLNIGSSATLNIGAPIVINGGEVATGQFCTINIISSCFDTENITYHYSEGDNGYLRKIDYTVLTGTGSVSIPDSIDWRVDGFLSNSNYSNGVLTVMSYDSSVYHVASGTIDYGTDVTDLATDTTKFCMKGGSLVLSKNLKDTQGIKVDVASSVSINNDVTLKASQLDTSAADVTLSGSGSYTLESGANALNTGVGLSDTGWRGTVNTTGDTSALELNTLGVSGSNVVLGSNSHTLAARDQSVAANLNSTGSISLTGYTLTLSGTNSLGSVSVGSLEITGGSTAISNGLTTDSISGTVSVTGGTLQEATAGSAISTSGTVALSNVTLGAVLNNSGTLNLGGTINVDSTALTSGTRERYSNEDNGYKTVDTTYTVLTGNAATGTATWKVGTQSATYEAGKVIVAGIEDKSVYYVRNGDVNYTQSLAQATTIFSLEGGHLQLGETLLDTQSIVSKNNNSWVCLKDEAVQLKSSQISLDGAEFVTLQAADGGTYIIDKKVGDIVELTLGTGVKLAEGLWWGLVKTVGDTTVSSDLDTTGWKNTELNGTTTVKNGATLTLGGNTTLGGKIENSGTLNLGGTINVDSTALTSGTRERYSNEDNGYKTVDTTYTVLTGNAATGTAAWKVGTQSATYEAGKVIVAGIEDTAVYYVRNGDVAYTRALANDTTTFSLDGGHLVLNESLKDTQSIEWKSTVSWLNINNAAVELKSSQLSTVGAGNFTLIAPDGGTYIIDKKVGDIVELTLGTGVTLFNEHWWGLVKTVGDTTVSSDLDTTGWKNTELNGTTTVKNGATLTLGGNTKLKGQIVNNGTLVLGGNIDVLGSMTHTSKATFATTSAASDLGTESGSGFATTLDVYTVVDGNAATGTATWTVGGQAAHYDSGKVSLLTNKDTTIWWMNSSAAYSTISGNFVTGSTTSLALNTENGTLQLDTDPGVKLVSKKAATVEIVDTVTLNANQLDARAAVVTLTGSGSYTMANGANTLGAGVGLSDTGWRGTVNTTGDTSALELDTLGVSGSNVVLGSNNHTLADREQEVAANLNSTGSISLTGKELTLNGNNTLGSLNVGSLAITGGSTTITNGLTIGGESSVATGATLSLSGNSTLGGKITNRGTLELGGNITVNKDTFKPGEAVENVIGYFIGSNKTPNSTNSGFEAACWDITIAEGGTITDNGATWKLVGDEKATFDFEDDGTLHAYGSGVGTVFHVAEGDTITYSESNAEDFVNSKGKAVSVIQLNGGTLELGAALDTTVKSAAASSMVIVEGVNLNADQLDASAADVTLSGKGSYNMQGQKLSGEVKLDNGVKLDADEWQGTVYTGIVAQRAALNIRALGNSQSTVHLGAQPMRRSMPEETVLERLTADGVGTTETPGSLTLQKGESTADTLEVNGILTLGTTNTAASLEADSVSLQELNFAHADSRLVTGKLKLEGATTLNVQLTDEVLSNKDAGETLELVSLKDEFKGTLMFNGDAESERVRSEDNRKEYTLAWNEGGTVLTLTILGTETYVTEQVAPTTGNGRAAVELMTDVFLNSRPQKNAPEGALAGILNAVDAGTATDRDMAAVAGASAAVLGQALSGDVERQLSAIRNRSMTGNTANTITLASEKSGKQTGSRFFAWVNAEGNRAEQDADSTAAGYTLTSWGGTLGAGMQVNDKLTLGLALTAMYGDLQSDAPDSLKGDMDTTYVSAFARYNRGKWSHAFIGTVGTMAADYKRTVSHAVGGYNTSGDTDGTAFGLMYEVSRSIQLSNRSTLSPVFNIAYRHTEVDSYSESGADAALNVGKQSLDTVTAGAGARYAAVVGQRMLNRACGFEARALVKYDLGDRQSKTGVGINGYATRAGIESAEMGAFSVELGAGISVPVGSGSIFADGAVELRSDYTNYNATVGYRIQF